MSSPSSDSEWYSTRHTVPGRSVAADRLDGDDVARFAGLEVLGERVEVVALVELTAAPPAVAVGRRRRLRRVVPVSAASGASSPHAPTATTIDATEGDRAAPVPLPHPRCPFQGSGRARRGRPRRSRSRGWHASPPAGRRPRCRGGRRGRPPAPGRRRRARRAPAGRCGGRACASPPPSCRPRRRTARRRGSIARHASAASRTLFVTIAVRYPSDLRTRTRSTMASWTPRLWNRATMAAGSRAIPSPARSAWASANHSAAASSPRSMRWNGWSVSSW